ncbi:TonB-dependent receptor [uncultured Paludibaculum sp.]|uniref:TonB-dependent receptor n=1 Tax=uncultured Paludibaculum sp. TaxID=1765020 RepID=UPI002AAB2366|nr:TonB-dependent receptor [uncultured Paludibaculum sp.]
MFVHRNTYLVVCLLALPLAPVFGQSGAGTISGQVTDPVGAAIPGASIRLIQEATNREAVTVSSDSGIYSFPSVEVGSYTLSVEVAGFKKMSRTGIVVATATRVSVDARMEVGDVNQTVDVQGEAPLLAAASSDLGTSFQPKFMKDAPLFVSGGFRNPENFISFLPGVNNGVQDSSINGGPRRGKEILIDGASHTNPESGGVAFSSNGGIGSVEQYGEFKLLNSNFSAEYGRTAGGIEVFVTKSGTNQFHGGVFEFNRNDAYDAAGWSINRQRKYPDGDTRNPNKAKVRQNEYGLNIGGPVWIPKVYNGKNKSFFYFTRNWYRQANASSTAIASIATQAMRGGDFSELGAKQIYDPNTTQTVDGVVTRTPFANNQIPASRFSSVSKNILGLIPNPTGAGISSNYSVTNLGVRDLDIWSIKADHAFNDRNRVSFFLSKQNITQQAEGGLPGALASGVFTLDKPDTWRATYDASISPTFFNHFVFGLSRYNNYFDQLPQHKQGWPEKLGLKGVATDGSSSFPIVTFTDGLTGFGNDPKNRGNQSNWTYTFSDTASVVLGRHDLKFGFEYRRGRTFQDPLDDAYAHGRFNYSNFQTAAPGALRATTGYSFASFLLGGPDSARRDFNTKGVDILYVTNSAFITDNIKVTSRLTLNIGVRYELYFPRFDQNYTISSFDPSVPNPGAGNLPGALTFLGEGPGRNGKKRFGNVYPTNFGPRLGAAYQLNSKTVLRGGYGIYYSAANGNTGGGCFPCGWGTSYSSAPQSLDGLAPVFNWDNGFTPGPPRPLPVVDPSFANGQSVLILTGEDGLPGKIQNWSFNVQRELPGSWFLDLAYVGMKSTHLNSATPYNQVTPGQLKYGDLLPLNINDSRVVAAGFSKPFPTFTGTLAQALRPYPQYLNITHTYLGNAGSTYNALQAKVERRYKSLSVLVGYTWSKALANIGAETQTGSGIAVQDQYNLANEKSYQRFDIPQTLNLIYTWDLPFGKKGSNLMKKLTGGWTVAGIHQYRSGTLLQPTVPNTLAASLFNPVLRANLSGTSIRTGSDRKDLDPDNPNVRWFDRAAFTLPGPLQFGTAAAFLNDLRTPPVLSESFSIVKRTVLFAYKDQPVDVELRADASNVLNRTLFGGINVNLTDPNFGRATAVQVGPRFMQLGIKVNF